MKKFKDFLYDKNDILIAVLILVVAAAIIAWRMDVILQYPKQLIHNDSQIETPTVDPSKTDDAASGNQTDNQTGSGDSTDGTTGENTGEDDANSGSQGVETLWAAGALTKDVEVDVTGNTATAAIQCLVDAGLFKDYAEYKQICTQSGLDDEKVRGGTFTFEKGSTKTDIAKKMALVPQNPFLISATIRENVSYGLDREVSLEEIKEACRKAFIDDFIENLPDKYETMIAEGGGNLSGGQRQRIAIARIFLRKPSILILDEATSALDNTTEKHIQKAIELLQEENNVTIISIAHRLSTLENCDNILVFDKGRIIQEGKYHELIETPGIFQDMYNGILK